MNNFIKWLISNNEAIKMNRTTFVIIPLLPIAKLFMRNTLTSDAKTQLINITLVMVLFIAVFFIGGMYFVHEYLAKEPNKSQKIISSIFSNNPEMLGDPYKAQDLLELISGLIFVGIASIIYIIATNN